LICAVYEVGSVEARLASVCSQNLMNTILSCHQDSRMFHRRAGRE